MNEIIIPTATANQTATPDWAAVKARVKMTWETGDFGQVAKHIVPTAEAFMARLNLRRGLRVLDVACGTGNLAVIAARAGCDTVGIDIAANLVAQARARAASEGLTIDFSEGDAEDLPYAKESFDIVVSMFGAMFAPRPEVVAAELLRVTKPGGIIAMANWTSEGFVGKMFDVIRRHVPPPAGLPSPLLWGDESAVRQRLGKSVADLRLTRQVTVLRYPFSPADTVEFFRKYFGPTHRAFASLEPGAQSAFRQDLEELQTRHNVSSNPHETETLAEYLEVHARKQG